MLFVAGVTSDHQCTIFWDGHTANSVRLKDASGGMTYVDRVQMQKDVPYPLRDGNIISFVPRAEGDTPSPGPIISRDYVYFHVPNELPVDVRSMYVLQSRTLGAGQTAVVREGIHKLSGARYAIKTYKLYNESSGNAIKRHVAKEIRAAASFRHPGICQILEVFTAEDGRITNAVFEYFDGTDLETYLRRFPRLSELTTQHISFQLCCALSHIHSLNIVHGDIKPTNILISQDIYYPIVKICDFGTAQLATLPRAEYVGCLAYSAPESMHPKIFNQYTTVADSWSLGAVIFFMLTNEPAYFDPDADINGERRLGLPIKWNNLEAVGVGIHCKNILTRMLRENPTQRISNILISRDSLYYPIVKICDFGTAQLATLPRAEYVGCLAYSAPEAMYPELFNQYRTVADSWSLGAVIFFMLTNRMAYNAEASLPIKWNALEAISVSVNCKDILAGMLKEDPSQRISVNDALYHPWLNVRHYIPEDITASATPSPVLHNTPTERWSPSPPDMHPTLTLSDVAVRAPNKVLEKAFQDMPALEVQVKLQHERRSGRSKRCAFHHGRKTRARKAATCLKCKMNNVRVRKPKAPRLEEIRSARRQFRAKLRKDGL
ncbi:kinase-like protein [Agrocybe pediades]|nr:kinase-like protein [Agrocybe pediades]